MRFEGRSLDPLQLWSRWVDFPPSTMVDGEFSPLVYCPNPDHDNTRTPAFQINWNQPTVHCFSHCGISGSYIHAVSIIEGVTWRHARKLILGQSVVRRKRRPRKKVKKVVEKPALVLPNLKDFTYLPQEALDYYAKRGISAESIAKWELGWNPETKRLTIPVRDHTGTLRWMIERSLSDTRMKYHYQEGAERNRLLFGACQIDPGLIRSRGVVLVEGTIDCIRLHQHGIRNAVALLGSYMSGIQRNRILAMRPKRIYTFFDRDVPGVNALLSVRRQIPTVPIYVCRYPSMKFDPAELSEREARRAIDRAVPMHKVVHVTEIRNRKRVQLWPEHVR